jgi:hypothetical protein
MSATTTKIQFVNVTDDDVVVTMYAAHKHLDSLGLSVRPQMLYTYGKKGYIGTVKGTDGKKTTLREINEWAERYQERKAAKATKIQNELQGK